MRGWLLDTNVISELRKLRPDAGVVQFVEDQPGETLFVSEVTFAEIRFGIEQLGDAARRADFTQWLDRVLRPMFEGRALELNEDIILRWKMLQSEGRRRGHTFSQPDLFIAATAAYHAFVAVSRDCSEFVAAGVPGFDPWSAVFHHEGRAVMLAAPVSLARLRQTNNTIQ